MHQDGIRFLARGFGLDSQPVNLGVFNTLKEAAAARREHEESTQGEFRYARTAVL
jgi:hypothetical protein